MSSAGKLIVRNLGRREYDDTYQAMRTFTNERTAISTDEMWCLEHPAVFTLGMAAKTEHILDPGLIPVVQTDRGGQVTYHGPGQLIIYLLADLRRQGLSVRGLVTQIEQSLIDMLAESGLTANRKPDAPGVYIAGEKIAALGIRVRRGCCYHGLALNVDMDTSPFQRINPCGFAGLQVTQLKDQHCDMTRQQAAEALLPHLFRNLNYDPYNVAGESEITDKLNHHFAA